MDGVGMNWHSQSSHILLNPQYSSTQQVQYNKIVEKASSLFPGHIWLSTSGSSSPKWVGLSKQAILSSAQAINEHLASDAKDIWIHALPEFHVGGLGIRARSYISGASVADYKSTHPGKWNARSFYQFLQDSKGTLTALVPAQLHDLIQQGFVGPAHLRALIIGGGGLSSDVYLEAVKLGWKVLPSYGLTECASQVATAELGSWDRGEYPPLKILSHISVEEGGGRLKFKGQALLSTYVFCDEDKITFFDPKEDGWFSSEDRGLVKGDQLYPQGRCDQVIKIGGESVDLAQLETRLQSIKSTNDDMALVAYPDARLGCVIHLAVAGLVAETVQGVVELFNQQVLPFERIREVHYVEKIPRSALSKVLKGELLKLLKSK